MESFYTCDIQLTDLHTKQREVVNRYFSCVINYLHDHKLSYLKLCNTLQEQGAVRIVDDGELLAAQIEKSIGNKRLPFVVLTHPFVVQACRVPTAIDFPGRQSPLDFTVLLDIYGQILCQKLQQSIGKNVERYMIGSPIMTWEDELERLGVFLLKSEGTAAQVLLPFYETILTGSSLPIIWLYPEGMSRGLEKNGNFKSGVFWLLKYIYQDGRVLKKNNLVGVDVIFVDQYNIQITNKAIQCRYNLLHVFNDAEVELAISSRTSGVNLLKELVCKYRRS